MTLLQEREKSMTKTAYEELVSKLIQHDSGMLSADCDKYLIDVIEIERIIESLIQIMFPHFLLAPRVDPGTMRAVMLQMVEMLHVRLGTQIENSLHQRQVGSPEGKASGIVKDFFAKIPGVQKDLQGDVDAALKRDPAATSIGEVIIAYPGILAICVHRLAHQLHLLGVPLIPRIMSEWVHSKTGIDIHPGAKIGKNFFIDHGTGVVIGETVEIGDNVTLYQGVTLGARSFTKDSNGKYLKSGKRHPTLGNNVTVYANAIILGGDTRIDDGAVIGASALIIKGVS